MWRKRGRERRFRGEGTEGRRDGDGAVGRRCKEQSRTQIWERQERKKEKRVSNKGKRIERKLTTAARVDADAGTARTPVRGVVRPVRCRGG